jgi:hypothetical protein
MVDKILVLALVWAIAIICMCGFNRAAHRKETPKKREWED